MVYLARVAAGGLCPSVRSTSVTSTASAKESNNIEPVQSGLKHSWDEVLDIFSNTRSPAHLEKISDLAKSRPRRSLAR